MESLALQKPTLINNHIGTLTLKEKHQLIENDIVLVKELYKTSYLLKKIGISEIRIKRVLDEITHLCKI